MAGFEKDDVSKLSDTNYRQLSDEHEHDNSQFNGFASISIPMNHMDETNHTDGSQGEKRIVSSSGTSSPSKIKFCQFLQVMNPRTNKVVQQWNKVFVISCLVAIFVDPLFFFLLSVQQDNKCIFINMPMTTAILTVRSMTDLIYFLHMFLQFRLAYVHPESTVSGAGELIKDPKKIALNYLRGYFAFDLFLALPLPQIIILLVLRTTLPLGFGEANTAKDLLRTAVLVQCLPRIYKFLYLLAGPSPSGFVFETAWANFVINLLTFVSSGHVVGSCWYLFGLQRVNQCLQDACHESLIESCKEFIDCGNGNGFRKFQSYESWESWKENSNANACFSKDGGFSYGIYQLAVNLTTNHSIITKYTYSLFWGFQQISTLAGNQIPSNFVWEILFTMAIIGLGLLLFALLIGNMQNFLQALGKRRLEMSLRRRDVEQWMSHRRLPKELRRKVRQAERYNFSATRGVNEEELLENLPEDVQRDIRRHLYKFMKEVRIFSLMDDPVLDAICERLRPKIYIKGSKILYTGGLVEKMVFIVRGKTESRIGEDGNAVHLSEGDVCGEELLIWCLEHSSVNKDGKNIRNPGQRLLSNKTVTCMTNVEAFSLRATDLQEVTSLFSRFLRSPRVQRAIRYESIYWRSLAAIRIQIAWRYKRKRLNRADTSQLNPTCPTFAHSGSTSAAPPSVPPSGVSEETNIMFQTMFSKMETLQASVDKLQTTVDRINEDKTFLHTQVMLTRERQDAMMQAANQSVTRLDSAIQELANIMRTR